METTLNNITSNRYMDYKNSGVVWLGEIPSDWELTRLGTRFEERKTKVSDKDFPPLSVTKNGTIPQLDSAAKSNDGDNRKLVKTGDFVINSRSDRKGSSGIAYQDGSVSLIYIVMEPKGIHPIFCNYLLKSYNFIEEFYRMGHGIVADLWTTRYDEMKAIMVGIPTLEEQTSIAAFLDRKTALIDQAIDIKQKQIELLKERRQILIHKAVTRGLNPNVKMKDSGVEWIGEIPEGWEVKPLKHLGYVFPGITGKRGEDFSKEKSEGMKPFIPFTNIFRYDVISNEEFQYVKIRDTENQNKILKNDLLFLMSSETLEDIGKCSIYLGDEKQLYLNSFCKGFRITCSNIEPTFVNALLLSNPYRSYFSVVGRGFTRMNIKQEYVNLLPILIPNIEEQNEIINYVNVVNIKIKSAISLKEQEIEKLKEYKATLINSAVTGKIKISATV